MAARTLYRVLLETARRYGDAPALRQPQGTDYLIYSWNQYRQAAEEIAAGLRCLGIEKGDIVALDSETRLEFYLADLGILTNGSIAAALYPNYPPAELRKTLQATGARAVFVEDPKTLADLRGADSGIVHWFLLNGEADGALSLQQLRERGRAAIGADPRQHERVRSEVSAYD